MPDGLLVNTGQSLPGGLHQQRHRVQHVSPGSEREWVNNADSASPRVHDISARARLNRSAILSEAFICPSFRRLLFQDLRFGGQPLGYLPLYPASSNIPLGKAQN